MEKHNFKVGDKVRLKDPKQFRLGTKTLTIIDYGCGNLYLPVWYEGMKYNYFPVKPFEIEHISRKGEQLTFSFMGEKE